MSSATFFTFRETDRGKGRTAMCPASIYGGRDSQTNSQEVLEMSARSFLSWLKTPKTPPRVARNRQTTRRFVPRVEALEAREVPAIFLVTGTADDPGVVTPSSTPGVDFNASTLRSAIIAANASVGVADTIT